MGLGKEAGLLRRGAPEEQQVCLVPFQESNGGAEGCKKLPEHGF